MLLYTFCEGGSEGKATARRGKMPATVIVKSEPDAQRGAPSLPAALSHPEEPMDTATSAPLVNVKLVSLYSLLAL